MATFVYSPGIRVHIETLTNGIIDVSDDLVSGTLNRVCGPSISQFAFALKNPGRKYDGVFSTMDKITVQMKRINWVEVFTGYLDTVPWFTVYASRINCQASCTLKRLQFFPWDPNTTAAYDLLHSVQLGQSGTVTQATPDGGMKQIAIDVLRKVVGWDADGSTIHIGRIPDQWFKWAGDIAKTVITASQISNIGSFVGMGSNIGGVSAIGTGTTTIQSGIPFTGDIPITQGTIGSTGLSDKFDLTGESHNTPSDPWYVGMHWAYGIQASGGFSPAGSTDTVNAAKGWWKNRKILIENPKNGKAVVVRAATWGPITNDIQRDINSNDIGTSANVLEALGVSEGDSVLVAFSDATWPLGDATKSVASVKAIADANNTVGQGSVSGQLSGTFHTTAPNAFDGVGQPSFQKMIDTAHAAGFKFPSELSYDGGGYHATGNAVDFSDGGDGGTANMDNFAAWVAQNYGPNSLEIIHVNRDNSTVEWKMGVKEPTGWYGESTLAQHHNHVHWAITNEGLAGAGAPGPANSVQTGTSSTSSTGATVDPAAPLFQLYNWQGAPPDFFGDTLSGPRALMNDVPIMPTIDDLMKAAQREYCSAPNGDFIAWFPDYFGIFGTAAKMTIEDIELQDFQVMWTDQFFKTHEFVAGSEGAGLNLSDQASAGGVSDSNASNSDITAGSELSMLSTSGIATVEFPSIMKALFGLDNFDSAKFLARYGARPNFEAIPTISGGGGQGSPVEFFFALYRFMGQWVKQWIAQIPLTFMPELFPGMLIQIPKYGFQAYVEQVTHNFSFERGGVGFTTQVYVSSYANMNPDNKSNFPGLPVAGGFKSASSGSRESVY